MKFPPFIYAGSLLFWGIETENIVVAVCVALLLEARKVVAARYEISDEDCIKLSDLTSLLFLGAVALVLINYEPLQFLRHTAAWLPVILSPLIIAQLYSTRENIIIGTRFGAKKRVHAHQPVDFRLYYIIIVIFAAATGNSRSPWFFLWLSLLIGWIVLYNRGRSHTIPLVIGLLTGIFSLGYVLTLSLEHFDRYLAGKAQFMWRRYYQEKNSDPFKNRVNIGEIFRYKESGEILMRVKTTGKPPRLLREASFSLFARGIWLGNDKDFTALLPTAENEWQLLPPPASEGSTINIDLTLPKEKGLLSTAYGAYQLDSATLFEMERNSSGMIKILDGAAVVSYDLQYDPSFPAGDRPSSRDLNIPEQEQYALQEVLHEIGDIPGTDKEKVAAVKRFFQQGFSYSLNMVGKDQYETLLGNFLLNRKSGFCEYYATGTTLLLRALGIPSRYILGYAILEKSWLEGGYIVRKRHAHAWAEAYIDNHWLVVDTTPVNWLDMDHEKAPAYEFIFDFFSFLKHKYQKFRVGSGADYTFWLSGLVVVLVFVLAIRLYRQTRIKEKENTKTENGQKQFARIVTPLTPLLDSLTLSSPRFAGESVPDWFHRTKVIAAEQIDEFLDLYSLHLQMRFDPNGLTVDETARLWRKAEELCSKFENITERNPLPGGD